MAAARVSTRRYRAFSLDALLGVSSSGVLRRSLCLSLHVASTQVRVCLLAVRQANGSNQSATAWTVQLYRQPVQVGSDSHNRAPVVSGSALRLFYPEAGAFLQASARMSKGQGEASVVRPVLSRRTTWPCARAAQLVSAQLWGFAS